MKKKLKNFTKIQLHRTVSANSHTTKAFIIIALTVLLLVSVIGSVTLGRYPISLKNTTGILFSHILHIEPFWTTTEASLLLNHRLPRILLACLVGCCLSAAGSAYQGVFQNPMAAPDILGASSGAAFGAALAILFDCSSSVIVISAFAASLLTVFLVMFIGEKARGGKIFNLVLSGIMVSSLISSATSFVKLVADPADQLPAITYWLMGSLNGTLPKDVLFVLPPMALGLIPLLLFRWRINVLTLGDDEARTLGINAKILRMVVILCATLITAASVSVSGVVGWIGLVIPHLARKLVGNDYRYLLPASMLFGTVFLLITDNISRNLMATEIPLGILTSFIGAPFFLYLMAKDDKHR